MLLVKIKNADRSESRRLYWKTSGLREVTLGKKNYNIKPEAIYTSKIWGGLLFPRTIDFVEGDSEPVMYYSGLGTKKVKSRFTPNLCAKVIDKLIGMEHFDEMIMILLIIAIGCSLGALYFSWEASNILGQMARMGGIP